MVRTLLCALHTFIELNRKVLGIVRMVGASSPNKSVFQTPNAPPPLTNSQTPWSTQLDPEAKSKRERGQPK